MVNFVLDKGRGAELLLSLFRLNNHEKLTPNDGESLEALSDWVFKARLSLTEETLTSLARLFSWEAFFGLKIIPYFFLEGSPTPSGLLKMIETISPERLLSMFLSSDFMPLEKKNDVFLKSLEENEKGALEYVSSIPWLLSSDRYGAFQMLTDQAKTHESFLELLRFAEKEIASMVELENLVNYGEEILLKNTERFEGWFLAFLLDIEPSSLSDKMIRLHVSAFLGGSVITVEVPEKNSVISLIGADRVRKRSLSYEKRSAAGVISALSDQNSLRILKIVMRSRQCIDEIAFSSGVHRHEVIEVLAALCRQGLVIPEIHEKELTFTSEERLIDSALEEIRKAIKKGAGD
ncbi:hypothetical protein [Mesotoga sp. H07.pep.5.3]|uniref:hypothetical protein n=1 Tax=Mesotoga sp. H07.pep.5.3 TaxID=1421003 RepID=UPI000C189260|nr:hypothetical protein [Mesotoga sp. H07.pep.5.3]PIJ60908.1 hypothetical protein V513_11210 [Mesotoga sp. H07.pep.5.3]